jgi:alpha-amylase/alpha-mannosidase (GH57 family)
MTPRYFCIHGHFYQPPRENPVLGRVEMQPSAWPQHDWNERVYHECYGPNAASRLLDDKGRIRDIWNNYAWMSFNAGATLLAWMEEEHPDTYQRILEADTASCNRLEGHGNAMAQVYNHTILPLASEEDKLLQIAWGMRDFEQRFKRKPEGMWLAETAIDMDTVVALIRAGIRFTVLAPTQAWKVRPLGGEIWQDVSQSGIDPKHPYRIFPLGEDGTPLEKGYLDIFFYDGPLSSGVGFEHLLQDAKRYVDRIQGAFDPARSEPQLVSICTDGESYGHHEPFGDMCAAYLFKELAPQLGMEPVNYAYWLAKHPPRFEVKLKNAYSGGTAWSCAHGTGRWATDCGCSTGAPLGWNQKWRAPLRQALYALSRDLNAWLHLQGGRVFRDLNAALLEAPDSWHLDTNRREAFWLRHVLPDASPEACALAMDLMAIARYQQYMFTSCGWFFADLTGIETVQVLRYAQRALVLFENHSGHADVRENFLSILAEAHSNLNGVDGKTLFHRLESEAFTEAEYLAFHTWLLEALGEKHSASLVQGWRIVSKVAHVVTGFTFFDVTVAQEFSHRTLRCLLAVIEKGLDGDPVHLRLAEAEENFVNQVSRLASEAAAMGTSAAFAGWRQVSAQLLPIDLRDRLALQLRLRYWQESQSDFLAQETKLRRHLAVYQKLEWPMPKNMQAILHVIENHKLVEDLRIGLEKGDIKAMREACTLARNLASQGVKVHLGPIKQALHQYMLGLGHRFLDHSTGIETKSLFVLLDLIDTLGLNMERSRLENLAFPLFRAVANWAKTGHFPYQTQIDEAVALLDRLNFSTDAGKEALVAPKVVDA